MKLIWHISQQNCHQEGQGLLLKYESQRNQRAMNPMDGSRYFHCKHFCHSHLYHKQFHHITNCLLSDFPVKDKKLLADGLVCLTV